MLHGKTKLSQQTYNFLGTKHFESYIIVKKNTWKSILHGSHAYVYLVSRSTDCLCSGLSFQECLHSEQTWKTETVSFSQV